MNVAARCVRGPELSRLVFATAFGELGISQRALVQASRWCKKQPTLQTPVGRTKRAFLHTASAGFSTSSRQTSSIGIKDKADSSSRVSVEDPESQTGIFYHPAQISVSHGADEPVEDLEAWSISYLSQPPVSDEAVIAYLLPPSRSEANSNSSEQNISFNDPAAYVRTNPDRVRINSKGWTVVHEVLRSEVVPNDDLLKFEAETRGSGWAHLTDLRHPLMPGRIATPENIIASVAFVDGQLDTTSYEVNDSYRLVTGYEGPIQMADTWIRKLRQRFQTLSR